MSLKLKPFLTAALLVAVGVCGARAGGACSGTEWVAGDWVCEEEDGGLVVNSGGDGDAGNLVLAGGAGFSTNVPDVNGGCGHSLVFPGTNAAEATVSTNSYDPLAGAEKFTLMAWVRRDSAPGANLSARIFSDADSVSSGANGVEFRFSGADGKLALRINGTEVESTAATVPSTNGVWHHVAVAWDGTRAATNYATRNAHFYVDGVQRGVGNVLQTVVAGNSAPAVVGNASAARQLGNVLAGNVDDVLVLPGWAPEPPGNGNTNGAICCFMDWNDDIFPPTITPPDDIERDAGPCLAPLALELGAPSVWDNCAVAGVTNDAPATFPVGLSTVTWTAWDAAGNTASAVQVVVVVPSRTADCDGDGLTDWEETMIHGSDYDDPDTDGDGLPDGWEVWNGLSPVDSTGDDGADGDLDGDGFSNSLEYDLGAPANNPAWNGAELSYRLMHATPVVTTNNRSVTTNWVGLRVDVEDSQDCNPPDGNSGRQNVVTNLQIPDLLECGYYVKVGIVGSVENVDSGYDKVYFNAATNVKYFSSHDGIPDELGYEWCDMVSESAVKTNLVLANSTVSLRYDTVGHKWHSGAYAQIVSATEVAPYAVNITGPDCLLVGDTASLSAAGAGGGPYSWIVYGDGVIFNENHDLTAISPGMALVTATDGEYGCIGTKSVALICVDSLEAYCPKFGATGSFGSNPEVFAGSLTNFWHPDLPPPYWWLPGDYELPASQALKVFYKYVKDGYGNVLPFDLVLRANLLPDGISDDCILYNWTKRSGPGNSGSFVEMDKREVRFRNPTQGGLYKFRLSVSVPGGTNHISEAWVLLPKAGGEVSDWLAGEVSNTVQRALAWKSAVEQVADAYGKDRRQFLETAWKQIASWDFDYQGVAGTPTPRYSFTDADRPANHVPDENIPGMQGEKGNGDWDEPSYATLEGVVVHRAKINNLM